MIQIILMLSAVVGVIIGIIIVEKIDKFLKGKK